MQKIIDWLLYLFLFFLPWQTRWVWHWGNIHGAPWEYGTYSIYGTEILLWLIIILFAVYRFKQKEFWQRITAAEHFKTHKKYLFFVLGFIVFLVVEVLHSQDVWLSYNYVFYWLSGLCLFVIISDRSIILSSERECHSDPPRGGEESAALRADPSAMPQDDNNVILSSAKNLFFAFWFGGILQGALALYQFLSQNISVNKWLGLAAHHPSDLGAAVVEFGQGRWLRAYGSFGWPNSLGIYLAVLLVLGVIMYLRTKKRWPKILLSLGQVIITVGLVLSFSRAAWLAAVCGLVTILIVVLLPFRESVKDLRNSLAKQIFFILAPVFVLFFVFHPLFFSRFDLQDRLENKSISERQEQYGDFKKIFFSHPWFGVGPGAYTLALSHKYPNLSAYGLQPIHNVYLLALAEWGIIGLILFTLLYCYIAKLLWKNNRIFISILLVLLISSLFDHWLYTLYTGIIFWWVVWGLLIDEERQ